MSEAQFPAYWDSLYSSGRHRELWEESVVSAEFSRAVDRLALPAAAAVLDIGCGSGLEACHLAARGHAVSGIDISPGAIELAAQRAAQSGLSLDLHEASALALPFGEACFAFAWDRGCLHLIPHDKWPRYAAEAARVLADDACLLLRGVADPALPDFHTLTEARLRSVFEAQGFTLVSSAPTRLVNAQGGLPGLQCLLRRRPRSAGLG